MTVMSLLTLLLFSLTELVFEAEPPPTPVIYTAIRSLAPHYQVGPRLAKQYARIIRQVAQRRKMDPLLVVSFIHVETARKWNPRLKSLTNDFGLCQVHVAARGSARFLGREEELYHPRTNIQEWVRLADMWRAYHKRSCTTPHPWWAHLKWGFKVKDTKHAQKVANVYHWLLQQLHRPLETS
jgi:hypothetical protein